MWNVVMWNRLLSEIQKALTLPTYSRASQEVKSDNTNFTLGEVIEGMHMTLGCGSHCGSLPLIGKSWWQR